jgi:hypothetical protein
MRRAALTARAAILAVAVASVALALAFPFKIWLAQRHQISSLRAQAAAERPHIAELTRQQQQWRDPAYIEQQARVRLHYVLPGQTNVVPLGPPPVRARGGKKGGPSAPELHGAWYARLWQSAVIAGASK